MIKSKRMKLARQIFIILTFALVGVLLAVAYQKGSEWLLHWKLSGVASGKNNIELYILISAAVVLGLVVRFSRYYKERKFQKDFKKYVEHSKGSRNSSD